MVNLSWCLKQKNGIKLIEPKIHLAESYLKESKESLEVCLKLKGRWKVISGYYSCYNALYAILMKCGIKSEIHDCTIKLMNLFNFSQKEKIFLEKFKKSRIASQYYLKQVKPIEDKGTKLFVLKCKIIYDELSKEDIERIREKLK